jgi:2-polyprenyl-6-methoxyphenol hydroxylase-like FAD-dependent oxidoreductase
MAEVSGSLAIEDAWVQAEVLRAEATVEGALAAYARRRRPGLLPAGARGTRQLQEGGSAVTA